MAEKAKTEKKEKTSRAKQEDKVLTIPLRREARRSAKNMRKNRSVRAIKAFLSRHLKADASNVRISQQLNENLWKGGLHNNKASIKVKVSVDEDGIVFARLIDEKERAKKESRKKLGLRQRLARRREGAAEKPPEKKPEKPAPAEKPQEPDQEQDALPEE